MNWRSLLLIASLEVSAQEADKHTNLSICIILGVAYKLKKNLIWRPCLSVWLWPSISTCSAEQIFFKFVMEDPNQKLLRNSDF
jgi:hypothetical protein